VADLALLWSYSEPESALSVNSAINLSSLIYLLVNWLVPGASGQGLVIARHAHPSRVTWQKLEKLVCRVTIHVLEDEYIYLSVFL
jgi:hypothetical protein